MQFSAIVISTFAALAAATPLTVRQGTGICPQKYIPSCCENDVAKLASTDCKQVSGQPKTKEEFYATCAQSGTTAECCPLPNIEGICLLPRTPSKGTDV